MVDYGLVNSATWSQKSVKVGLGKLGCLGPFERHRLCLEHVSFHLVEVHVVVKLNDVDVGWVGVLWIQRYFDVHPGNTV